MSKGRIDYGRDRVAVAGLVVAAGIAIGVPAVVLYLGDRLDSQSGPIMMAIFLGVMLGVVSVVFGVSVPSSIRDGDDRRPKEDGRDVIGVDTAADESDTPTPSRRTDAEQP